MNPALAPLFTPLRLNAALTLRNRIALAPCTRNRATDDMSPTPGAATHYASRADAGLLITEGTIVAKHVQGYIETPGIFLDSHVRAWAKVTDAVHQRGGTIFLQLWHTGRMAHSYWNGGTQPLGASAVLDPGRRRQTRGLQLHHEMPRAMTGAVVLEAIGHYRAAAARAKDAGFDGIEIHGANGYLPEQFLRLHTNKRTDEWGGSAANRARLGIAVVDACAEGIGAERVGLRLSPAAYFSEMRYTPGDNDALLELLSALRSRPIAYIHTGIVDDQPYDYLDGTSTEYLRRHWQGTLIGNGAYTPEQAASEIAKGGFDLIAWGRIFLANPDLLTRLRNGAPLAEYSRALLEDLT